MVMHCWLQMSMLREGEDLAEAWQTARGGLPDALKWAVSFFSFHVMSDFFFNMEENVSNAA